MTDQLRDAELRSIEAQMRVAIRDAVNRSSRKPFHWGGLVGYQELQAIAQELHRVPVGPGTQYLEQLIRPVDRVLKLNRALAQDLHQAHVEVERIAACLRYPSCPGKNSSGDTFTSSECPMRPAAAQVVAEMQALLEAFRPDPKHQPAQAALRGAWGRLWRTWGPELLPCYDIPGLPSDNLKLESLFGSLRRHQRRISGRKSTQELRDHGHYQVLFKAESEEELLEQLQRVPRTEYESHSCRLSEAEAPRRFLRHLHHDPGGTMKQLVAKHMTRLAELGHSEPCDGSSVNHTI